MVEHNLAKVGVAGSSPVSRSREEGSSVLAGGPSAVMMTFAGLRTLSFSEMLVTGSRPIPKHGMTVLERKFRIWLYPVHTRAP